MVAREVLALGGVTVNSLPDLGRFLGEFAKLQPKSVAGAFESFLKREIDIALGTRSKASDSQNHLREFLSAENSRDRTFPRILSKVDSDFLGGSFGRRTKIWPLDDMRWEEARRQVQPRNPPAP